MSSYSHLSKERAVKRTELIWLKPNKTLGRFCHLSKNLYNEANYLIKQSLREKKQWLQYNVLYHSIKKSQNYQALPALSAQQTLILLDRNWKAFFVAIKEWSAHPEKFKTKPKPPRYKKKNGEFILIFTSQQIRRRNYRLKFPKKVGFEVTTRLLEYTNIREVRIIPKGVGYVLEIVYTKKIAPEDLDHHRIAGIDLGVSNLVTLVNNIGKKPIVIKGGVAKSINQYYNKKRAQLQWIYEKQGIKTGSKLQKLTVQRNHKLHDLFHKTSRFVVSWCVKHNVGTLIIGYNQDWKQHVRMRRVANQNFVYIPFSKLIAQLQYKAEENGIRIILQEENHTSKCSFLDQEPITHHKRYAGRRKSRGLFESMNGILINADVNGGYNIIKKALPEAFVDGIEGVGLHPERYLDIYQRGLIST